MPPRLTASPWMQDVMRRFAAWSASHIERGCAVDVDGLPLPVRTLRGGKQLFAGACCCQCPDHECLDSYLEARGVKDVMCQTCRDTGHVRNPRLALGDAGFGRALRCPACNGPGADRRVAFLWEQSNIPEELRHICTFGHMADDPESRALRETLERWLGGGRHAKPFLVLAGKTGRGKTYAAIAVARELIREDLTVYYTTAEALIERLRQCFDGRSEQTVEDVLRQPKASGCLVLDDLGAEYQTPYAAAKLLEVINHRYERRGPLLTVITTNVAREETPVNDRLWSRVYGTRTSWVVTILGPDRRKEVR